MRTAIYIGLLAIAYAIQPEVVTDEYTTPFVRVCLFLLLGSFAFADHGDGRRREE